MKIIKKRVNNTAIVVIDNKMYTRTNVDDGIWIEILEQIEETADVVWEDLDQKFFSYEDDLNTLNIEFVRKNKDKF